MTAKIWGTRIGKKIRKKLRKKKKNRNYLLARRISRGGKYSVNQSETRRRMEEDMKDDEARRNDDEGVTRDDKNDE